MTVSDHRCGEQCPTKYSRNAETGDCAGWAARANCSAFGRLVNRLITLTEEIAAGTAATHGLGVAPHHTVGRARLCPPCCGGQRRARAAIAGASLPRAAVPRRW